MNDMACLAVHELECIRGDRLLFSGLDFELHAGELLHVLGTNGSGKTSLLRILCGLLPAENGEIRWCGRPVAEQRAAYLQDLAYLGHHPGIKGELTPLENLHLLRHLYRIRPDADPAALLTEAGLGRHLDVPARTLSAGQRQRIGLTRLRLQQARLWILDEPFTSLDVEGVAWVEGLLEAHLQTGGLAVLTSHQSLQRVANVRTLCLTSC
ncbi:heme exporter protein A [Methylomarinovum tepidoasis]|uniref:Heme exporter protein A n=1 Tax=Methylomarinovum tepidoasis TaxID=2840183 RepID=A0AAU9CDM8_9GAMM|nr:cytochrome c biogenesis heme-transporting ATPase CcmA [Methylomarinovum sp. IN45]BCX88906.1 heme exporter protein A [Methylomarinovum sp. IN45]